MPHVRGEAGHAEVVGPRLPTEVAGGRQTGRGAGRKARQPELRRLSKPQRRWFHPNLYIVLLILHIDTSSSLSIVKNSDNNFKI